MEVQLQILDPLVTIPHNARHRLAIIEAVKTHARKAVSARLTEQKERTTDPALPKMKKQLSRGAKGASPGTKASPKNKQPLSRSVSSSSSDTEASTPRKRQLSRGDTDPTPYTEASPARRRQPSRSSSGSNLGENAGRSYIETNLDQGCLKVTSPEWVGQEETFCEAVRVAFGKSVEVKVANNATVTVHFKKHKIGGKMKGATINYYPTSGCFTLTGPKLLRDGDVYNFFHNTIEGGPNLQSDEEDTDTHTPSQMSDIDDDLEDVPVKDKVQTQESVADEAPEQGLHLDIEEGELDAPPEEDPLATNMAETLEQQLRGAHALPNYLAQKLVGDEIKKIKGEGPEADYKRTHARTLIPLLVMEQYISDNSMPPDPETTIAKKYMGDAKTVSSTKLYKWLDQSMKKWVVSAAKITNFELTSDFAEAGDMMMMHMRSTITTSMQRIAGLAKQVAALSKELHDKSQQRNIIPKIKDRPVLQGTLDLELKRMKQSFASAGGIEYSSIQTDLTKNTNALENIQARLDNEAERRVEAGHALIKTRERLRKLETAKPSDTVVREVAARVLPELQLILDQALDKHLEAVSSAKRTSDKPETLSLEFKPSPNKRAKTEPDRRQRGNGAGGSSGGQTSSRGSKAAQRSKGRQAGRDQRRSRSRSREPPPRATSLLLDDDSDHDQPEVNPPAYQAMPKPRWKSVQMQLGNVAKALEFAGMTKGSVLDSCAEFTYGTIRSGAFSASALLRMLKREVPERDHQPQRMNEAVSKMVGYFQSLESKYNMPSRS